MPDVVVNEAAVAVTDSLSFVHDAHRIVNDAVEPEEQFAVELIAPLLIGNVRALNSEKIRIDFDRAVSLEGEEQVSSPSSYTLLPVDSGAAVLTVLSVDLPPGQSTPTFVELNITEMTDSALYSAALVPGAILAADDGGPSTGIAVNFAGLGENPTVLNAVAVAKNRVVVTFSESMFDNAAIRDISRYSFDGGLSAISVESVNGATVVLRTSEQSPGTLYNLTVFGILAPVVVDSVSTMDALSTDFIGLLLMWQGNDPRVVDFANADADRRFWFSGVETGPFAANVPAVVTISGVRFIQIWDSFDNLMTESERLDDDDWSLLNSATVTANTENRPNGQAGADRLNMAAHNLSAIQQAANGGSGLADNKEYVMSVYHKAESGTEDWRFQTINKGGAGASIAYTATTTWQREQYQANTSSGGTAPTLRARNAADALARNVVFSTPQWEGGLSGDLERFYSGPPVPTSTVTKTRPADVCSKDSAAATLFNGKYEIKALIDFLTSELQTGEIRYILYVDANNYLAIVEDAGVVYVRLATTGGTIQRAFTATAAASRPYILTLTINHEDEEITIDGAQTGNGTTAGTRSDWPQQRLWVGMDSLQANQLRGALGEPRRVE